MITPEEYDKVQMLLGLRGRPRPKRHVFAFVGMMKCGECGLSITAESKTKFQKNGNVHNYTYYHCTLSLHEKTWSVLPRIDRRGGAECPDH